MGADRVTAADVVTAADGITIGLMRLRAVIRDAMTIRLTRRREGCTVARADAAVLTTIEVVMVADKNAAMSTSGIDPVLAETAAGGIGLLTK
jgi:hypothetical protein